MTIQQMMLRSPSLAAQVISVSVAADGLTPTAARATIRFLNTGVEEKEEGGTVELIGNWLLSGSAGDFAIRASLISETGEGFNVGTFDSWLAMSTTREWYAVGAASTGIYSVGIQFDIALAGTTTPIATGAVTLTSEQL